MRLKPSNVSLTRALRAITRKAAIGGAIVSLPLAGAFADPLPPLSIGAGMRTSFAVTDVDGAAEKSNDFNLDSIRLYINGSVTDKIKFTFNTEYNGATDSVIVMDAVGRFEYSDQFNIWAGRFLPPSDRANLYGPYYANHWGVYIDGIQDGWPFTAVGRDNGIAYWGQFGRVKVSAGAFDVPSTTGDADVVYAARVMADFLDIETGYYLNSTYYGGKDLLAVGGSIQSAGNGSAYAVDFLFEKNLSGAGVVTVESEYAKYDGFGGYLAGGNPGASQSDGFYVLGGYLFPKEMGMGKLQVVAKYATATHDYGPGPDVEQKTKEVNLGYIMKEFNARAYLFMIDVSYDNAFTDFKQYGLGLQLQM